MEVIEAGVGISSWGPVLGPTAMKGREKELVDEGDAGLHLATKTEVSEVKDKFCVNPDTDSSVGLARSVGFDELIELAPFAGNDLEAQPVVIPVLGFLVQVVKVESQLAAFAPHVAGGPTVSDGFVATGIAHAAT